MTELRTWQLPFLGLKTFPAELTALELQYFFGLSTLPDTVRRAISATRSRNNRLALAIHIGFLRMTGRHLMAFNRIPVEVLQFLGHELGLRAVPELATLRALYRRQRTLFEHQRQAAEMLGFQAYTDHRERALVRELRHQHLQLQTVDQLLHAARRWLYQSPIVAPGGRRLRDSVARVYREGEQALFNALCAQVPEAVRRQWAAAFNPLDESTDSIQQELRAIRRGRTVTSLDDLMAKLVSLRALGIADHTLDAIPFERQRHYARCLVRRRRRELLKLRDPRRTLEQVSYLRVTLLELTDQTLQLADLRITDIRRQALAKAQAQELRAAGVLRQALMHIHTTLMDTALSDNDARTQALSQLNEVGVFPSRAAALRFYLSTHSPPVRPLLKQLLTLPIETSWDALHEAMATLRRGYDTASPMLSADDNPIVPRRWQTLIPDNSDRKQAFRAFEAQTLLTLQRALLTLQRALRTGAAWMDHSLRYRSRDQLLIPAAEWVTTKARHYRRLKLPTEANTYLKPLLASLETGLSALAEAVLDRRLSIDDKGIHLPALEATGEPHETGKLRERLFRQLGQVQLPELLMGVDSLTRFSWALLGRAPASEQELLVVYGALLASGTALNANDVALMTPSLSEAAVRDGMLLLEDARTLREANDRVMNFMQQHPIVTHWGEGRQASSDAMNLEVSRHLWNARVDPRRRTYAVGSYSHLLDRWGIIYDQPVVIGERQAGVAIEGVMRQQTADAIDRLAVDSHGFTDLAMGLAKLLGFDLCPRIKGLRERKLHLPTGLTVPEVLKPIVKTDVSLAKVAGQWDEIVRLAASVDSGRTSAVLALHLFGSAARGDPIHQAGTAFGQLQRSLYLCDYLTLPDFRRELLRLLDHGESLHSLQRVIYAGSLGPKRGRRRAELTAVTGSLALLTNIVLAWTTHRMQSLIDQWSQHPQTRIDPALLAYIAPVHFRNINFKGELRFPLQRYAKQLLSSSGRR